MLSSTSQFENVLNDETPDELVALTRAIEALPAEHREALRPTMNRVLECSNRRRKILQMVQEALGQLRLDMKYLVFDLEATRRERDSYRRQIDGPNTEE